MLAKSVFPLIIDTSSFRGCRPQRKPGAMGAGQAPEQATIRLRAMVLCVACLIVAAAPVRREPGPRHDQSAAFAVGLAVKAAGDELATMQALRHAATHSLFVARVARESSNGVRRRRPRRRRAGRRDGFDLVVMGFLEAIKTIADPTVKIG